MSDHNPNLLSAPAISTFVSEVRQSWERARAGHEHFGDGNPLDDFGAYLLGALTNPAYGVGQAALRAINDFAERRRDEK